MKKILLILCLIMLTGCYHKTLEEKMQGQWIITERTVLIERKNGDYTEFYTKVDLQTKELIEYKRNSKDNEFIKLQTTKSEEAFIIVEYSGNQNIISSKSSDLKTYYDIEYFDNYIEYSYTYSDVETFEDSSKSLEGITNISFVDDKMITMMVFEIDGKILSTKVVLVKIID